MSERHRQPGSLNPGGRAWVTCSFFGTFILFFGLDPDYDASTTGDMAQVIATLLVAVALQGGILAQTFAVAPRWGLFTALTVGSAFLFCVARLTAQTDPERVDGALIVAVMFELVQLVLQGLFRSPLLNQPADD
jgi:hypothetical protein